MDMPSQKVKVEERNAKGETARALAMMYGYTKIASLIDSRSPKVKAGNNSNILSVMFHGLKLYYT